MNGEAFGLTFAQMVRTDCTECGSTDLQWGTALDLLRNVPDAEFRSELRELIAMMGGDSDAWICRSCGLGFGVFGPTHVEGF